MSHKLKAYILIGASGSGKSTYANKLNMTDGAAIIVSPDKMREQICGDMSDQSRNGYIFTEIVPETIAECFRLSHNIIFDATSTTRKARKSLISQFKKFGYEIEAHVFRVPIEVCQARNVARTRKVPIGVIQRQFTQFQEPTLDEGFSKIVESHMNPDPTILNREYFNFRECVVASDPAWIITPKLLEAPWTPQTLIFRSIILRQSDNKIISIGHKKFFNYTQATGLYPDPLGFGDWHISTKVDGSSIIISKHNGELIVRTRGVLDVGQHETGPEIQALVAASGIRSCGLLDNHSILLEHTSPNNQIVIAYPNPELTLLDIVRHEDCAYLDVKEVDQIAANYGIPRPAVHHFGSLAKITETLRTLKGMEGYVLSYNGNQNRIKLKAEDYLLKHRFKERATLPNTLELWIAQKYPALETFKANLVRDFDFESYQMVEKFAVQIDAAYQEVQKIAGEMVNFVEPLKSLTRKEGALEIQKTLTPFKQSLAFTILSGKSIEGKQIKKAMELVLEIS